MEVRIMKALLVIATFHLKNGGEIVDESMSLKMLTKEELTLFTNKDISQRAEDIDFVTLCMFYGNSSRLLFSVTVKEIHPLENGFEFTFYSPKERIIKIGDKVKTISCSSYDKLYAMLKPRTGKNKERTEVITFV